jgi:hypothetical protein
MEIELKKSNKKDKKLMVIIGNKVIHFGAKGYNDYTIYSKNNPKIADNKKKNYLLRHKVRENWSKSGINTSGFWSRYILWNKKTINQSIKDTENRFKIKIKNNI